MSIGSKFVTLANLNGGLATRPTPLLVEADYKKRMKSPALRNVDFFTSGSIAKRLGKTKQGDSLVSGTDYQSQTSEDQTTSIVGTGGTGRLGPAIASKITTTTATAIASIKLKCSIEAVGQSLYVQIYSDSAGSPGSVISNGSSSPIAVGSSSTPTLMTFTFPVPPSLSATTNYHIVLTLYGISLSNGITLYAKSTAGSVVKTTPYLGTTAFSSVSPGRILYYAITSTASTTVVQGVYDYRFGSASTQRAMAAVGGALYYHARNATPLTGAWTSLVAGLASGQDSLWSFATLSDYLFTADFATNAQRVWNGAAAYTIAHGFRPAGTFARSATGGSIANGVYKVMLVTTLTSGGYRSGVENTVTTIGGGTDKIAASGVVVNNTGSTDFGFDAAATCTTVFMTLAGGSTYYKLATGSVSVGNPLPNGTTSFNITASPAGTENTLLLEYTKEQGYFTSQVTTPVVKYLQVFQNMLALAGDASYPSRVWFSGLGTPMIYSTRGGIEGSYLDFDSNDGEVITGIKQWNGNLYVFKRHSVYIVEYTGVASSPFVQRKLAGTMGCLSHWTIKEIGAKGLIFLSERGPGLILGTFVVPIPATANILDRFDLNNTTRYNLSAMAVSTAGNNATKSQIHFGVSSTSATTRDITLVYDYENEAFWENDVSANYYTEVSDANFFPTIWSGDYSAQIFQHDSGTNDNGSAISFYFDTPLLQLGTPFSFKQLSEVFIAGAVQSTGTLLVDVFLENSTTATQTLSFDMTNATFKSGQSVPCGMRGRMFRLRLRNADLDVPVEIDAIGLTYNVLGNQY